jgi:hypothetical protein
MSTVYYVSLVIKNTETQNAYCTVVTNHTPRLSYYLYDTIQYHTLLSPSTHAGKAKA